MDLSTKEKKEILKRLCNDEDYYGDFGKQFLSNSDIRSLLKDPLSFKQHTDDNPNLLMGQYFHTLVLEPDKLERIKIIDASTRNTNIYKELSNGELCLLQHEADNIKMMRDAILENATTRDLIRDIDVQYEVPGLIDLYGEWWKCKADIKNNTQSLIVDLKTTSDIDKFRYSANEYNYDSQAYIYSSYFNMDMVFIVVDKKTKKIGIYDCSTQFLERGRDKVERAIDAYRLFFKDENFDFKNYCITETL
jgi:hypothetical protein